MRIFLDANVLFSAAKSDGAVRQLLRLLVERGHRCCADAYVVAEARRNLLSKSALPLDTLDALLDHVEVAACHPGAAPPAGADMLGWLPEKDRPVLAAAIAMRCEALVTGDRTHFGAGYGRTFAGVTLHSPRSLAEALLGDR